MLRTRGYRHRRGWVQEMAALVSNSALAHSATTTDQEEFCGLVNTLMGPTLGRFNMLK